MACPHLDQLRSIAPPTVQPVHREECTLCFDGQVRRPQLPENVSHPLTLAPGLPAGRRRLPRLLQWRMRRKRQEPRRAAPREIAPPVHPQCQAETKA
jgi:hypothetical protein